MKRLLPIILFLMAALPLAAQPVRVAVAVSQQKILIGEPFQLTLRAQVPANYSGGWFALDTLPHFEIQNKAALDTVRSGAGDYILVQNIRLTSWDSGKWAIPPFSLSRSNKTKPLSITVSFSPMDPAQPYHDIKDIQEVERPGYRAWWWYLVGLALVLFFLLLLFPSKKKKPAQKGETPETAYREAMRQLDALSRKKDNVPVKEFYTDLIGVLRSYLMHRKDYQSSSKTTVDLQAHLPDWGLNGGAGSKLVETLQLSDGVKFARFEADAADRKTSLETVRESIVQMEQKKQ